MKHSLTEIRLYWKAEKRRLDQIDEQEDGLHIQDIERYDMICDIIDLIEWQIKHPIPTTADGRPLQNQMEVWSWADDDENPEHPTRLLVNMWSAGPDAMVDCMDPETMHSWCCRADELYWSREEAENAKGT